VALTPTDAIVVPTQSESQSSTSNAAPASTPFSNPAPKTTHAQSPKPRPTGTAEPAAQDGAVDTPAGIEDHDTKPPQETQETTRTRGGNVWPLPPSNPDVPDTTNALSILESAQASAEAAQIAASIIADAAKHQSKGSGQSGDGSAHDNEGSDDPIDSIDPAAAKPARTSLVWTQASKVFTAVLVDSSARIIGAGAATTVMGGNEAVFEGQNIKISPEGDRIEINGAALGANPIESVANAEEVNNRGTVAFEASGHTFTAVPDDDGSLVLQAAGTTTTIAYGDKAIFAGNTLSLPSSGRSVINVDGELVTLHPLNRGNNAVVPSSTVWTQGGETFTARMQSGSVIVLEAAGTTKHVAAGSTVTLGDAVFSVRFPGGVLVHDGTSATLNRAAATEHAETTAAANHDSTAVMVQDAASSVVVEMGGGTFTLADGARTTFDGRVISAKSTGGAIVMDGTTTIEVSTRPTSAHMSEDSSSTGGTKEESTGTTTDAQSAGSASRPTVQAAITFALFSFLAIAFR
jgi:hypothetical protein